MKLFINKARFVHGDKYDYSKVEYVNNSSKVCIICPTHGEFWQIPSSHLSGNGCNKCAIIANRKKLSFDTPTFIERAKLVHGDKYDYSKVEYINAHTKICVICPMHGEFSQEPNSHINGQGCNKCGRIKSGKKQTSDTTTFIEKAKEVHGDKYDYSKVEYINNHTKICIICPIHGEFYQMPSNHLCGKSCNECGKLTQTKKRSSNTSAFISKSKLVHGDKYDYSKVEYKNAFIKICIICPIHGEFYQRPNDHLRGEGCNECGIIANREKLSLNTPTFIERAKKIHGDKYDYSKVEYINSRNKVCIICSIHGEYEQIANYHLSGYGCPNCSHSISNAETEIGDYIESLGLEVIRSNRKILSGMELDLYVPSRDIAIEYNGLRWHSEEFGKDKNYHLNKTLRCKEQDISLIHIFEDEYLQNKELVLNKIKHILKLDYDLPSIMGRKCKVEVIDNETAKSFLDTYHIQGYGASTLHLGAVYGNELIAVMSFKKVGKECLKWDLLRFASNSAYVCQGVGGKLFKHFIKNYKPSEVKTFADRRWVLNESDNLYTKLDFYLVSVSLPKYKYVVGTKRIDKNKIKSLDTYLESNLNRIWDCGLFKYMWKKES